VKRLIFLLLLIPQICFAQTMISNRDIKQHPATKLFISGNHLVSDFEDASNSNNQITKYADVKTVNETSTNNPKYFPVGNDKGIYFDGTGDYLSLSSAGIDDFTFPAGTDFSLDFWIYPIGTLADKVILSKYTTWTSNIDMYIDFNANSTMAFVFANANIGINTNTVFSANKWYHVSLIRSGTECKVFVNGIYDNNDATSNFDVTNNQTIMKIGTNTTDNFLGFMQNIRISKGIARWTSNFTPPALNSTYTTDSYTKLYIKGHDKPVNTTAMTDDSGTSKTITTAGDTKVGYSRGVASYFDGTGDYLSCPKICSDDYTKTTSVELWYYPTANNNTKILVARGHQTNGDFYLAAETQALTFRKFSTTGNTIYGASLASVFSAVNKWYHIVAEYDTGTADSGVVNFWVNGIKTAVNKGSSTATYTANTGTTIGGYLTTSPMIGYIAGLKVKEDNIAPYSAGNFTPPETEPIADSYTKLLLKQKMLKIPDIATAKAIGILGIPSVSTAQVKTGKNSIYFDGNYDKLYHLDIEDFEFGAGDFTFDMWFNTSTLVGAGTNDYIAGKWQPTGGQREYGFILDENEKVVFYYSTNGTAITTMLSINAISINTWYHIAAVKSGTNIYLFVNGILQETDTGISSIFDGNASIQFGGWENITTDCMNGYLSDIRLTKGKALWTSNFTPPRRSGAY
jgi:hypothetical protein